MTRSWSVAVRIWVAGGLLVGVLAYAGEAGLAIAEGLVLAALGLALSPLVFPRSLPAQEAQRRSAGDGRPIVYWRPGCRFCLRLRLRLGRRGREARWVNIWADPDGAAAVRAATGGDETVPTVVLDGVAVVNPDPAVVRSACLASGRS
ncbi:glutaredoxin domain-containing protein [Mumia qirimensis]|uniref:glutaredoxin domain-containing protein n=1 Tax=Mumia qirimensis TaxID=3234852 RepID=UPI00351D0B25